MPSSVRVFVRFEDQCVFAGEELKCTITFRNVVDTPEPPTPLSSHTRRSSYGFPSERVRHARTTSTSGRPLPSPGPTGHTANEVRDRLRMMAASQGSQPQDVTSRTSTIDKPSKNPAHGHRHRGSVSIISGVSTPSTQGENTTILAPGFAATHRRSSTVQYSSGPRLAFDGAAKGFSGDRKLTVHGRRRVPLSAETTPPLPLDAQHLAPESDIVKTQGHNLATSDRNEHDSANQQSSHSISRNIKPKLLFDTNVEGSERTSADFYSLSNHSQETMISEQPSVMSERPYVSTLDMRQLHRSASHRRPQTIKMLMGYAHVTANFILDGSLVNPSPFEEVKEKGFLGGQRGGGVVGATKTKRTSGLLSGFSLDSIGESLSGMLSGNNLSSVKEMKATTSSRAIPLLSTPQSLLFVNINLEPGEEKSFTFAYKMPRGLPSSFRGKAIRINYNLTIGIQRSGSNREAQFMKQINVPIRLFSGVSRQGEILGHDLMQPHVVLQDLARTKQIDPSETEDQCAPPQTQEAAESSKAEFLKFIDTLLDRHKHRQSSTMTLDGNLTSAETGDTTNPSIQAINRAIMLSNQSEGSTNRFEITHNGLRVAVVIIDRPLHRLGETVTCVVDFANSQVACASLRASLETTEKVTPELAVRSAATISRVTKRVYAAHAENVLFAKRVAFCPSIPSSATPTFITSGVNLEWGLNIQFGTVVSFDAVESGDNKKPGVLEEIGSDEKGVTCVAKEVLQCETLEVVIPITVYGDIVPDMGEEEDLVGRPI